MRELSRSSASKLSLAWVAADSRFGASQEVYATMSSIAVQNKCVLVVVVVVVVVAFRLPSLHAGFCQLRMLDVSDRSSLRHPSCSPVFPQIPDMTSDTDSFITLQVRLASKTIGYRNRNAHGLVHDEPHTNRNACLLVSFRPRGESSGMRRTLFFSTAPRLVHTLDPDYFLVSSSFWP